MCMMLYLGSDNELPIIPYSKDFPDFYAIKLGKYDFGYEGVRNIINKKYLYNTGAHTGCGCGFNYGAYEPLDDDDIQEEQKCKQSVNKLFEYIKEILLTNKNIELYVCIAGDEGKNHVKKTIVDCNQHVLGDCFFFESNELWNIES